MGKFDAMKKAFGGNVDKSIGAERPAVKLAATPAAADPKLAGVSRSDAVIRDIVLGQVEPDPGQHRKTFTEETIAEMAASLKARGQLSAILVYWCEASGKYRIVCGERRYRGASAAGWESLRCEVLPFEPTAGQVAAYQLVENEQREDLAPLERARSYQATIEANGWTQADLCKQTGLSKTRVSKALALLNLAPEVQGLIEEGRLDWSTAYELRHLDAAGQAELGGEAADLGWTASDVRDEVGRLIGRDAAEAQGRLTLPVPADLGAAQRPQDGQGGEPAGDGEVSPRNAADAREGRQVRVTGGPDVGPEWGRPASFVVTLEDGSEVAVEYDGEVQSSHWGTMDFRGPINPEGSYEHRLSAWQATDEPSVLAYAERFARDHHARAAERARHEAEKAEVESRNDRGFVAGWEDAEFWRSGESTYYYTEGADPEDGQLPRIELEIDGRGWPRVVEVLMKAWKAAKFRAALAEVDPRGAMPGDLVEPIDPEDPYAGKAGAILDRVDDVLHVLYEGLDTAVGSAQVCYRGEKLRRVGPGPKKGGN